MIRQPLRILGGWSLVAGLLLVAGITAWRYLHPAPVPQPPAAPAAAVAEQPRVATPMQSPTVQAYKPAAKKALRLPAELQADASKAVVAASTVQPSRHAYTLTTLIDTATGEVQTVQRQEPLPWLARDDAWRYDLLAGVRGDGDPAARLSLSRNLLRIKRVEIGAGGAVTWSLGTRRDTDWLVGVHVGGSFE